MGRPLLALLGAVVAVAWAAAALAASGAGESSGCRWAWRVEQDRLHGPELADVVAVSASEAWAVGWTASGSSEANSRPAILRWDGRRWAASPTGFADYGQLYAVDASGPDNVWAIGSSGGRETALVLHWDGRKWTRVSVPDGDTLELAAVAVVSADDVWLGRQNFRFEDEAPTFQHWDGRRWTSWHEDVVGVSDFAVLSATDIWAVGERGAISSSEIDPVVLRWEGSRWTEVPTPHRSGYDTLSAIDARTSSDAWAVGTRIQRWDGSRWRVQAMTPRTSIAVADRGRVHAVGSGSKNGIVRPLVSEWDGRWSTTTLPGRGSLASIARVPGNGLLAVGGTRTGPHAVTNTLIARFSCR